MKNILATSILALAGMAVLVPSAKAGLFESANWQEGDLVIAIGNANHTGNTYLVDIGNISLYTAGGAYASGTPTVVNAGQGSAWLADLSTAGISLSTATYSVFGSDFSNNVQVTQAHGSGALQNGQTAFAASDIQTMIFGGDSAAASSTANGSFTQNTTVGTSYASYNLGSNSPTQSWATYNNAEGTLSQSLDLYNLADTASGNAPVIGIFSFNSATGALTFTTPVPEPGTFAFGFALIGACAMGRFRRRQAAELVA